jgi:hypothetical protein
VLRLWFRKRKSRDGVSPLWRAIASSPFQIPLMAYLFIESGLFFLYATPLAKELGIPSWPIYNLVVTLALGSGLGLYGRVKANERIENFGLMALMYSVILALIVEITISDYLGTLDEIFIGLGCYFRMRVLAKAREAEKMAIRIVSGDENVGNNNGGGES